MLNDKENQISCIRGLFDTDGSIYRRYKTKKYAVVQFKLMSDYAINQIKETLNKLDIYTTKIGLADSYYVVRITSQKEIDKFFEIIKPNNKWHVNRYLKIRSEPDGI